MRLETIDFPSDVDGVFGDLQKLLAAALHRAADHPDHLALLRKTLKFSTDKLKDAKADYDNAEKVRVARAEKKRLAEEAEMQRIKELRYGKVGEEIEELTDEQKALATDLGLNVDTCDEE